MNKPTILLFLFTFFLSNAKCNTIEDSLLITNLNLKARKCFLNNSDSGFIYTDSALSLSKRIKNNYLKGLSYKTKGVGYYYSSSQDKAISFYDSAIVSYSLAGDSAGIATCLNNIAVSLHLSGNLQQSIDYHFKSLAIREKLKSLSDIAMSYQEIGITLDELGKTRDAINYTLKALEIYKKLNDQVCTARALNNIGTEYNSLHINDSAIFFYKQAIEVYFDINYKRGLAITFLNIANNYTILSDYQEAMKYYNQSLELAKELNDVRVEIGALTCMASMLKNLKQYNKSEKCFNEAIHLSKTADYPILKRDLYYDMALFHEELGHINKSYKYYKKYISLKDSIVNTENTQFITELEKKYQTEKKTKEIELLQKENELKNHKIKEQKQLAVFLILFTILSGIITLFFFKWNRSRQVNIKNKLEIKNLRTEQKMLRSQMNPHFIYNSLNSIQSFISSGNSYEAEKYLASFAKLMRGILENSREEFVPLDKEIQLMELYMNLEKLRFENRFDFQIQVDDQVETEFIAIPPMLMQPYIENAILHGFKNLTNGLLEIKISEEEDFIICQIDDNGIGREKAGKATNQKKYKSLGTQITEERFAVLYEQTGKKGSYKIIDKIDEKNQSLGTKVILKIPYIDI